MPRMKKKGTAGSARNFLTRSQAVRKLQISLGDFRRLCIFKGIYPREPKSKKKVSRSSTPSTTFYYAKDIQFLLHEPLIAKFRAQKALAKKISKALGRNEVGEAVRLEKNLAPKLRLDHIIKERYPTFVDALRDLDDALSMLYLFANLPSTAEVPAKIIARCQRLTLEFEHYLIRTHSLRKSFLSIKGIYYQATIQGQDILWLVPYKFVQRTGGDVDFRIMATFVDFYTTLLGFVNFRLYTSIGVVYPPRFDAKSEEQGAELAAFQLEGPDKEEQDESTAAIADSETNEKAQAEADRLLSAPETDQSTTAAEEKEQGQEQDAESSEQQQTDALDKFASIDAQADTLLQPLATADSTVAARLFEPFTFFLSRETPRHPIEFLLKSFGCKRVGWNSLTGDPGSFCNEKDTRITHQIVDRPDLPLPSPPQSNDEDDEDGVAVKQPANQRVPGRIYVQPQWVWDSINAGQLQRPDFYAPGATLPPHLSPWVKPKTGDYDPTLSLAEQETAAEAEAAAEEDDDDDEEDEEAGSEGEEVDGVRGDDEARELEAELAAQEHEDEEDDGGMTVQLAASDDEDDEDEIHQFPADDWDGFSGDEDEDAENDRLDDAARAARAHQADLEAEALGRRAGVTDTSAEAKKNAREIAAAKRSRAQRDAEEDLQRRKMMMPRRKRKVYDSLANSNAKREQEAEKLRTKRRRLEKEKAKGKA